MIATRDFLLASSSGPDVSGGWANAIGPYAYANAGQFLFSALRRKDRPEAEYSPCTVWVFEISYIIYTT